MQESSQPPPYKKKDDEQEMPKWLQRPAFRWGIMTIIVLAIIIILLLIYKVFRDKYGFKRPN